MRRYAIATILAVGLLTLARPAETKIVYTPANVIIGFGGVSSYNLDLNNDGVPDFTISSSYFHRLCFTYSEVDETPASGNGAEGAPPAALNPGNRIGPSQTFYAGQGTMAGFNNNCGRYNHSGNWWNVTGRYLGLMFQINGKTHYGWAQLNFKLVPPFGGNAATLTGYAYETIAGKSILAGATMGAADGPALSPDSANPEDSGPGASVTDPSKKQPHYFVKDLGTLGGTQQAVAEAVSNRGWVVGAANLAGDQNGHSFLWRDGVMTDLGTLGGPNSAERGGTVLSHSRGIIAGAAETSATDPLGEDFCQFGTGLICLGFFWEDGKMTPLPTLGGDNSWATAVNDRGRVVGFAENGVQDTTCVPPQVLDYEPVIWERKNGGLFEVRELPRIPGDPGGYAFDINDRSQVVGVSGNCSQMFTHAVLWEHDTVTDMGNLGSDAINQANSINSRGEVVGLSSNSTTISSFLWHKGGVMTDLGILPGDASSGAATVNDRGQVVGESCDQTYLNGNCRAYIWEDGVMTDLNTLVKPGSTPLHLVFGNGINLHGEIAIYAFNPSNGEFRAALAIPCDEEHADNQACNDDSQATTAATERPRVPLPANVREQIRKRLGFGRFASRTTGRQNLVQ